MDPADLGLDAKTLASIPGLGGILLHGQDFFDRPSGTIIPQFATPLASYLDGQTLVGTSNSSITGAAAQADASAPAANPSTLDYDHFSDRVDSQPAPSAYDQFSDAVANSPPRSVGGLISDAVGSSQITPGVSNDSSGTQSSDNAPQNAGGSTSSTPANSSGNLTDNSPVWDPFGEVAAAATIGKAIGGSNSIQPDAASPEAGAATATNSPGPRRYSNGLTPAEHIATNSAKGKATERTWKTDFEKAGLQVREQPMFETDCGLRFRLDFLIHDPELDITSDPNHQIGRIEIKSSEEAKFSPKQKLGIPIMEKNGARLVTSFPGFYLSGTRFSPGMIDVKRRLPNEEVEEPAYVKATEDHIKIKHPGQND